MTKSLEEIAQSVGELKKGGRPNQTTENPTNPTIQSGKKFRRTKKGEIDQRHFNVRTPGTGMPPGGIALMRRTRKQLAEEHLSGMATITLVDKKTNKVVQVERPRIVAALEKTFELGMKGDVKALDNWSSRALGKAPQPLVGDEDSDAIQVNVETDVMVEKIYDADEDD